MATDLLKLYDQASEWTVGKIKTVTSNPDQLDTDTPCDEWKLSTLLDHMLETQRYFVGNANGEDAQLPQPAPPKLIGSDPAADFEQARAEIKRAFADPAVQEKTGPALGIAFSDLLLHGWDVAVATGQDATMPNGLADAAYEMIHGRFTVEQRKGVFKPEVRIGDDASPQDRLLAYTGRDPKLAAQL
jgi:uncharacterized protein (TIGR03086 family)